MDFGEAQSAQSKSRLKVDLTWAQTEHRVGREGWDALSRGRCCVHRRLLGSPQLSSPALLRGSLPGSSLQGAALRQDSFNPGPATRSLGFLSSANSL